MLAAYAGLVLGDFGSGFLSQVLRIAQEGAGGLHRWLTAVVLAAVLHGGADVADRVLRACAFGLGVATGYWAVFVTVASEQFGTNIRATVTTTAPNFVRGSLVPVTFAVRGAARPPGRRPDRRLAVGVATLVIALLSLLGLPETFGKDLDYVEPAT